MVLFSRLLEILKYNLASTFSRVKSSDDFFLRRRGETWSNMASLWGACGRGREKRGEETLAWFRREPPGKRKTSSLFYNSTWAAYGPFASRQNTLSMAASSFYIISRLFPTVALAPRVRDATREWEARACALHPRLCLGCFALAACIVASLVAVLQGPRIVQIFFINFNAIIGKKFQLLIMKMKTL